MNDGILVSIIVPIYNVADYVSECIRSLVNQTYKKIEIILVVDGSPDSSFEICRSWEEKDNRIKVINQENQGVSIARNRGIDLCSGEWICFVDGDDYLEINAIENMLCNVDEDTDVLITDYFINNEKRESFFNISDHDFTAEEGIELIKNTFVRTSFGNKSSVAMVGVPWAKLFKAETIKNHDIWYDGTLKKMQDAIFCDEVFRVSKNIKYRSIPTYHYVINVNSVTHRGDPSYKKKADAVLVAFDKFIKKYHYEEELYPVYYARRFMFACEEVKYILVLDNTGMKVSSKVKEVKRFLDGLDLNEKEPEVIPYFRKDYLVAYYLYKIHAYGLIYIMTASYYWLKKRRMKS